MSRAGKAFSLVLRLTAGMLSTADTARMMLMEMVPSARYVSLWEVVAR